MHMLKQCIKQSVQIVFSMDSVKYVKENDVSDPLKHLLSLDWESNFASNSKDFHTEDKQSKSVKKVRFSDEVQEIFCDIDTNEIYTTNLTILDKSKNIDTNKNCILLSVESSETLNKKEIRSELNSKVELTGIDDDTESFKINSAISFDCNNLIKENTYIETEDFEKGNQVCANKNALKNIYDDIHTVSNISENGIINLATQIDNMTFTQEQESNAPYNQKNKKTPLDSTHQSPEHVSKIHGSFIGNDESDCMLQKNSQFLSEEKNRQRIYQKSSNEKQSRKLNSILTKEGNISNASELKTTVFNAWYKVKNKTKIDTDTPSRCETKLSTPFKKSKEHVKAASKHAYTLWKKSKNNKLLQNDYKEQQKSKIFSAVSQEVSKIDEEEREMAFKSWKKRKDVILKNEYMKEKRKELEYMQISSMNAIQKKKDSEEAFLAWETHKSRLIEIEHKKKAWLQQKEKEEYAKKCLRDKEALETYYLWLETKHFACEKKSTPSIQLKPPWIPPGKSPT